SRGPWLRRRRLTRAAGSPTARTGLMLPSWSVYMALRASARMARMTTSSAAVGCRFVARAS
ncbi:hypothetical protein, partial [Arthrobacter sp. JCM 19049]|uniref:hypothetical protein n=1 Tax=Arthrobacter sp. JCM 19049 TaxID=1460643 RepID=UPI0024369BC5